MRRLQSICGLNNLQIPFWLRRKSLLSENQKSPFTTFTHKKKSRSRLTPGWMPGKTLNYCIKKLKKPNEVNRSTKKKVEATKEQIKRLLAINEEIESALHNKEDNGKQEILLNKLKQELSSTDIKIQADSGKMSSGYQRVPFYRFVTEGWEIFIGKSDTQNDELSTHFAHPCDIWLHVAGYAGSHVIIRRPKDKPYPQPDILKKAAALAAWFSKAKHTSYCEVHYTEARFVRKRKHAPAGEVIAERCKTIRVAPKSPQDLFRTPFLEDSAAEV